MKWSSHGRQCMKKLLVIISLAIFLGTSSFAVRAERFKLGMTKKDLNNFGKLTESCSSKYCELSNSTLYNDISGS